MVVSLLTFFRGMLVRGFPPRIEVRGRLFAGMTNSEGTELWLDTVNQHGGFCHAPTRPQRGTSPSPREVFDRATFPSPPPLWIPAFAGMTSRERGGIRAHSGPGNIILVLMTN